jgi:hypothetical protein
MKSDPLVPASCQRVGSACSPIGGSIAQALGALWSGCPADFVATGVREPIYAYGGE